MRRRGWRVVSGAITALFAIFIACAVAYGATRAARSGWLFFYTEGNVMASIGALLETGSLSAMYPNDGWITPPLIMTLYPPVYPVLSALLAVATGTETTLAMPRLISLLAMGMAVAVLIRVARSQRAPVWLVVASLGTLLLAPPFSNLLAAAQVDVLALGWTAIGVLLVLNTLEHDHPPDARIWISLPFFLLAFFTKQSFVAAPVALVLTLAWRGSRRHALGYAVAIAALAAGGLLLFDGATDGGYLMNTAGALTGALSGANLMTTFRQSRPLQWLPVVLLLLLWAGPALRLGFVELWLVTAWFLNVTAMVRVGASVNYLIEPLFAVMLVGIARFTPVSGSASSGRLAVVLSPRVQVAGTLCLLAWAALATAPRARQAAGVARAMWGSDWNVRLDGFDIGYPLVDAQYVPAVRHEGTLPYLNDTFAFGVLIEAGRWNPESLLASLRAGAVPFILTDTDLRLGPRPDGTAPGAEGFAHFWRIPSVQRAIRENYELTTDSSPWVWRPRASAAAE